MHAHSDEHAHNMHIKRFSRAQNLRAVKSVKTLLTSTSTLFKVVSFFCVWKQIIFSTIRSGIHTLFLVEKLLLNIVISSVNLGVALVKITPAALI